MWDGGESGEGLFRTEQEQDAGVSGRVRSCEAAEN